MLGLKRSKVYRYIWKSGSVIEILENIIIHHIETLMLIKTLILIFIVLLSCETTYLIDILTFIIMYVYIYIYIYIYT